MLGCMVWRGGRVGRAVVGSPWGNGWVLTSGIFYWGADDGVGTVYVANVVFWTGGFLRWEFRGGRCRICLRGKIFRKHNQLVVSKICGLFGVEVDILVC